MSIRCLAGWFVDPAHASGGPNDADMTAVMSRSAARGAPPQRAAPHRPAGADDARMLETLTELRPTSTMRGVNRPLDPLLSPRSIAVVGASRDPGSLSWALLHNLVAGGFTGPVYPVNPATRSIHSLLCYPSVAALPEPPDLAVIAVPAAAVPRVVDECLDAGARGLVVISAGFAETGEEGREVEAELRGRVRAAGARMIGPNCMGVINTDPAVRMNATFAPVAPRAGSVGFVSQSGALGMAILTVAAGLGVGLTQFVSMGNKADVSGNDLLEHWEHDPATRVICMYLESFGNPRRFLDIARRVGRRKPILMVKAGRTVEGARAASSHTGALAGSERAVTALLAQAGVLRVGSIEELLRRRPRARPLRAAGGPPRRHRHQRRRAGDHGHRRSDRAGPDGAGAGRRDAGAARRAAAGGCRPAQPGRHDRLCAGTRLRSGARRGARRSRRGPRARHPRDASRRRPDRRAGRGGEGGGDVRDQAGAGGDDGRGGLLRRPRAPAWEAAGVSLSRVGGARARPPLPLRGVAPARAGSAGTRAGGRRCPRRATARRRGAWLLAGRHRRWS